MRPPVKCRLTPSPPRPKGKSGPWPTRPAEARRLAEPQHGTETALFAPVVPRVKPLGKHKQAPSIARGDGAVPPALCRRHEVEPRLDALDLGPLVHCTGRYATIRCCFVARGAAVPPARRGRTTAAVALGYAGRSRRRSSNGIAACRRPTQSRLPASPSARRRTSWTTSSCCSRSSRAAVRDVHHRHVLEADDPPASARAEKLAGPRLRVRLLQCPSGPRSGAQGPPVGGTTTSGGIATGGSRIRRRPRIRAPPP